jgi:hypothetical protein
MTAERAPKKRRTHQKAVHKSAHDSSKGEPDSFVDSLKNEWNLFWESLVGENQEKETEILPAPTPLTLEQVKALTKALSADRKRLNLKLEEIRRQIEENSARLETLKVVGGSEEETFHLLSELSDQGQKVSEQLHKVDERFKIARAREDEIKKAAATT